MNNREKAGEEGINNNREKAGGGGMKQREGRGRGDDE